MVSKGRPARPNRVWRQADLDSGIGGRSVSERAASAALRLSYLIPVAVDRPRADIGNGEDVDQFSSGFARLSGNRLLQFLPLRGSAALWRHLSPHGPKC